MAYSESFLKSLPSPKRQIAIPKERVPTAEEVAHLKALDDEIHRLQDERAKLEDLIHKKRREADEYASRIYEERPAR